MIEDIRVVLVETSHPGNIGAVARSMKNMGLKRLFLVNPKTFPSALATERSAGADDILEHAQVVPTLKEAISDCELVLGTSARLRQIPRPTLNPKETAEQIFSYPNLDKVAVIFGTERSGLTNDALAQCHYHIVIPANPNYSSLNLAQAVQIISYELYQCYLTQNPIEKEITMTPQAPMEDILGVFDHMETVLDKIEFLNPKSSQILLYRIKRMILKTKLETEEVNILRGIFKAVLRKLPAIAS
jgi:tRNA (cytidine32/uridine32-2'-O)-methyltransferase